MKLREQAAKQFDEMMGKRLSVEDQLSIKELIDLFEQFGTEIARNAYAAGNDDGADGINQIGNYIKKLK